MTSPTVQPAQSPAKLAAASQWLQRKSPRLHALVKSAYRKAEDLLARPWFVAGLTGASILTVVFGLWSRSWLIFTLAGAALIGGVGIAAVGWIWIKRLTDQVTELSHKMALLEARLAAFERDWRKPKI